MEEEAAKQKQVAEEVRRKVIEDAASKARELITYKEGKVSENCLDDVSDDSLLANVAEEVADPEAEAGDRALLTAMKHKSWLEARSVRNMFESGVHLNLFLNDAQELERIFGPGAAQQQLALEYQAGEKNDVEDVSNDNESGQDRNSSTSSEEIEGEVVDDVNVSVASGLGDMKISTPTRGPRGKKRFKKSGFDSSSSLSPVRNISSCSEEVQFF